MTDTRRPTDLACRNHAQDPQMPTSVHAPLIPVPRAAGLRQCVGAAPPAGNGRRFPRRPASARPLPAPSPRFPAATSDATAPPLRCPHLQPPSAARHTIAAGQTYHTASISASAFGSASLALSARWQHLRTNTSSRLPHTSPDACCRDPCRCHR